MNCTTEPAPERVALGALRLARARIRVRLWLFAEQRLRLAYERLVDVEAKG